MSRAELWDDAYDDAHVDEAPAADWRSARAHGAGHVRSLSLGLVAMAPLLVAYEVALDTGAAAQRNLAEQALLRGLAPLGALLPAARALLVVAAVAAALVVCYRRRVALVPSVGRIVLEGAVAAVVLGPLLALAMRLFGGLPPELQPRLGATGVLDLGGAARLLGGAAWEELLFRVLCYGGLFLLARRVLEFFGAHDVLARGLAEGVGLFGSSLAFAALHLEAASRWLGPGGESWSAPVFLWRSLAGILLALLFRWRGPGVAAWAHALFNVGLALGAGAGVLS
ncbi:MAG: hypothetical protein H6828_11155 [Planctomycetes bacterium]|nr:hypothetical protein [Planctomycetota bacterium]